MEKEQSLKTEIAEELGYVSSLFMKQECKGTEIVMPTAELEETLKRILLYIFSYTQSKENEIRQDTLRQVLPIIKTHKEGEGDYCDTGEDMNWACRSNCVELAVERLINKAKEIWGLELNN